MSVTPWAEAAELVRHVRWSVAHVRGAETGSGFFLAAAPGDDELALVTNAHVVEHEALVVTYGDETV